MEDTNSKYEKIIDEHGKRISKIESYWHVTIVVAAILGVGGAWLGKSLQDALQNMKSLQTEISQMKMSALSDITSAKDAAILEQKDLLKTAIQDFKLTEFTAWLAQETSARKAEDSKIENYVSSLEQKLNNLSSKAITHVELFSGNRELLNQETHDKVVEANGRGTIKISTPKSTVFCSPSWVAYHHNGDASGVLPVNGVWRYYHYKHNGADRGIQAVCMEFRSD